MRTKVTISSSMPYYMVYAYHRDKGQWLPIQAFSHNERDLAVQFAKDLATIDYAADASEQDVVEFWDGR